MEKKHCSPICVWPEGWAYTWYSVWRRFSTSEVEALTWIQPLLRERRSRSREIPESMSQLVTVEIVSSLGAKVSTTSVAVKCWAYLGDSGWETDMSISSILWRFCWTRPNRIGRTPSESKRRILAQWIGSAALLSCTIWSERGEGTANATLNNVTTNRRIEGILPDFRMKTGRFPRHFKRV